jgi:putative lipoic acid-binding regulatory protein
MSKLEIEYPCEWSYTVIGPDEALLRAAIAEVFCGKEHSVEFSKKSKAGKYISLVVTTKAANEEERANLCTLLSKHPAIKMVL